MMFQKVLKVENENELDWAGRGGVGFRWMASSSFQIEFFMDCETIVF